MTLQGKKFAHWNYRVVEQRCIGPDFDVDVTYAIHEMYYEPDGWSHEPATVTACSVDALRVELDRMLTALEMDVIVDG